MYIFICYQDHVNFYLQEIVLTWDNPDLLENKHQIIVVDFTDEAYLVVLPRWSVDHPSKYKAKVIKTNSNKSPSK